MHESLNVQRRERYMYDEIGKKLRRKIDESNSSYANLDHQIIGRRFHMLGPPGTLNTITPCAACKLLWRRCAQECPFSPYFSPHEPHKFASVHKVFAASNVSKMLVEVPENQRADTANSLVYEASVRLRDPVYGCMGAISALQQQVHALQTELNVVRDEILKCKYREVDLLDANHHDHNQVTTLFSNTTTNSGGVISVAPPSPPPLPPPSPPPLPPTNSSSSSMYSQPNSTTD